MNTGYGSNLTHVKKINDITLEKKAISEYGKQRIKDEINFYQETDLYKLNFPLPKISSLIENGFTMEYLENYTTYQNYLQEGNTVNYHMLFSHFNNLHSIRKKIDKEDFIENLKLETFLKVKSRYQEIEKIINKYSYINKVNGLKLLEFSEITSYIENYVYEYLEQQTDYKYYPTHGDLQLNNILIDPNTQDIKFIDPKGCFGKSSFFGMKQYDYAKFYFGLGGYSYFDTKKVDKLNIKDNNLIIDIKPIVKLDLSEVNLTNIFIISIWLGNAHCFINNELKVIESFFYALYLATQLIKKV